MPGKIKKDLSLHQDSQLNNKVAMIYHKILENNRVRLRALEPSDVDLLYKWENDTDNWLVSTTQTPFSREILTKYIENSDQDIYTAKQLRLMIVAKDQDNKTIGAIDLFDFDPNNRRAGVGILIDDAERQKHYGTEALERIIEYGFSVINLHQLYASVLSGNDESLAMFKGHGFVISGTRKDWIRSPKGWVDEYVLQLIGNTNSLGI